jgi:hypothetical protein
MNEHSHSEVDQTSAGSITRQAQTDTAAAARASAVAAQTAASQAAATAAGALAQEETVADVGQGEAYILNMKRIVENALTFDEQIKQIALQNLQLGQVSLQNAVALANRVSNGAIDLDVRVKQDSLDTKVKTEGVAHSEREETIRDGKAMDVIREMSLSENPVMQDAIVAGMVAAVDRYLAKSKA